MHLKFWFSITFAIDGSFIRLILYFYRDFLRNIFGVFAKEVSSKSQSSKKNKFPKITFTNLLKNAAELYWQL